MAAGRAPDRELVERVGPANVTAVDPLPVRHGDRVEVPGASVLRHRPNSYHSPITDRRRDPQLVVHFMADPVAGLGER